MTRIFGAGLAIATLAASPAFAAGFDWTRFYAGVEGGGGWGGATQTDNTPFDSGTYDVSGGLAGLTAGYDWESNHMVAGVASDFSWASIGGSTSGTPADLCGGSPSICSSELQWLGTVRGRFGYASDNVLSYLTGGAAFGSLYGREGTGPSDGFYGDGSAWRLGWTVGAGVEARINQHWTAGIEYLYVDLGDGHVFDDTAGTSTFAQFLDFKSNIVRVSLNYQFGTP